MADAFAYAVAMPPEALRDQAKIFGLNIWEMANALGVTPSACFYGLRRYVRFEFPYFLARLDFSPTLDQQQFFFDAARRTRPRLVEVSCPPRRSSRRSTDYSRCAGPLPTPEPHLGSAQLPVSRRQVPSAAHLDSRQPPRPATAAADLLCRPPQLAGHPTPAPGRPDGAHHF